MKISAEEAVKRSKLAITHLEEISSLLKDLDDSDFGGEVEEVHNAVEALHEESTEINEKYEG